MSAGSDNAPFSNRTLGWSFVLITAVLIAMMIYIILRIVQPLASQTSIASTIIQSYAQEFDKNPPAEKIDEDTVRFLLGLEYSAAAIRTVSVQIAFASVGGFFLIVVGILLFASGAIRPMTAEATGGAQSFKLQEAAPGTVIAVFGAIILGLGVTKQMTHGEITFTHKSPATTDAANPAAVQFNASTGISTEPVPADPRYQNSNPPKGDPGKL